MPMKILAFDPSLTCTGYAVLDGLEPRNLLDSGYLKPDANTKGHPVLKRIESLCSDIPGLIDEHQPTDVVVETTSGHVNKDRHRGGGSGLAIYGMTVMAVYLTAKYANLATVVSGVEENVWTAGRPKSNRSWEIAAIYPEIRDVQDGLKGNFRDAGGDVADAIGLGRWWWVEHMINQRMKGGES